MLALLTLTTCLKIVSLTGDKFTMFRVELSKSRFRLSRKPMILPFLKALELVRLTGFQKLLSKDRRGATFDRFKGIIKSYSIAKAGLINNSFNRPSVFAG